jgi:hypothetical protein
MASRLQTISDTAWDNLGIFVGCLACGTRAARRAGHSAQAQTGEGLSVLYSQRASQRGTVAKPIDGGAMTEGVRCSPTMLGA